MRVPSYDAAALEAEIGPRGATVINTANRGRVQNWLVAKGCPSERAKAMRVQTLWKMYNRERYCDFVLAKIAAGQSTDDDSDAIAALDTLPLAGVGEASDYTAPAVPSTAPVAPVPAIAAAPGDTAAQLAALIQTLAAGAINESRVIELIREHATAPRRHEIVVTISTGESRNIGTQHRQFETLLRACAARDHNGHRLNVMLAGPPGSGKTTAAENVARALGLAFRFNGAIDNEYKLLGFTDAQGRIVSRPFREIYENGGVYLFDEIDGSLPGAVLAFNAATANGYCDFPDGPIARHPDCVLIAAGNTAGHGATDQFTGRTKLDLAFLDRFALLIWEIDEALESATCPDTAWCEYVQAVRRRVAKHGVPRAIVSPRASYMGAGFLAAGLDRDTVIGMVLRKGMSADQWQAVA